MDDSNLTGDSLIQDLNEIEPDQGEGAANFSAKAQRDRFLGGAENKGGASVFNLSHTDINPGGGLVVEKKTAILDQSRQLLHTPEFQELGLKYRLRRPVAEATAEDIKAGMNAGFSDYVIGSLEQSLAEMPTTDNIPELSVSMPEGSMSAASLTAKDLLEQYMFALAVRDSLGEVTEIATAVDEVLSLQRRFPRQYLKVGMALGQDADAAHLVPYYSVNREGLRKESFAGVEERASEILEYTGETAGEFYRAGRIPFGF